MLELRLPAGDSRRVIDPDIDEIDFGGVRQLKHRIGRTVSPCTVLVGIRRLADAGVGKVDVLKPQSRKFAVAVSGDDIVQLARTRNTGETDVADETLRLALVRNVVELDREGTP